MHTRAFRHMLVAGVVVPHNIVVTMTTWGILVDPGDTNTVKLNDFFFDVFFQPVPSPILTTLSGVSKDLVVHTSMANTPRQSVCIKKTKLEKKG